MLSSIWILFDFRINSDKRRVFRFDFGLRRSHLDSVILVNHTHIGYTLLFFEEVCDDAFGKHCASELPVEHLIVSVNVNLYSSDFSLLRRFTNGSPRSCLFLFVSFGVVNLSVRKVESEGLFIHFIFDWNVVFWSYSELNTVQF